MTTFNFKVSVLFFLMFLGLGATMATASSVNIVGTWDGTASVSTDEGFSTSNVSLAVLAQQGSLFSGTMQFGMDAPFNVNGVVDKQAIRITGSSSTFDASVSGRGLGEVFHGTGSRFETNEFPSATVVFDLRNKEYNCVHSNGTVQTQLCCGSAGNFRNTCGLAIGACGCPPSGSHEVSTCDCGANRCFNGIKCVSQ